MADSLSIGGTSLDTYGTVMDVDGAWVGTPDVRGESEDVPRRQGLIDTYHPVGGRTITIRMVVTGATRAAFHDNMRALAKLVFNSGQSFVLTRVVEAGSTITTTATARYLRGLEPQQRAGTVAYLAIDLEILDGYFYASPAVLVNPGTVSIAGDATTRYIDLGLPGAGTLTNTTLGVSVTVTTTCNLSVIAWTADAGIATLSWSGDDYWFALAPGSNTITWSAAGTANIYYYPAYL